MLMKILVISVKGSNNISIDYLPYVDNVTVSALVLFCGLYIANVDIRGHETQRT